MICEIRDRDGLARSGILKDGENSLRFPAVVDAASFFSNRLDRPFTNVPLGAPRGFAEQYLVPGEHPTTVHPQYPVQVPDGDIAMVSNWHTALQNPRQYVDWLISLKTDVRADTAWYAPAAALPSTVWMLIASGFDLFDTTAVDLKSAQQIFCLPEGEFPADLLDQGVCACQGCRDHDLKVHNRLTLEAEVNRVSVFLQNGQLRELAEARCRLNAAQVSVLRHLDNHYDWVEQWTPVARTATFKANSGESMNRPEVKRFVDRLLTRYIPPSAEVAVLLPCSARKPYSRSQSHRRFINAVAGRAHEIIITSPLGVVPREIELCYPAAHYDVPVTGYWDREEVAVLAGVLAKYLAKHQYRRVIAHLEGGAMQVAAMAADICGITLECTVRDHPTSGASLSTLDAALAGERRVRSDQIKGMLSFQFNAEVDTAGMQVRGKFPRLSVMRNRRPLFSLDTTTGMLRPTFEGWSLIPAGYRVVIDDFVPQGDILAPGVLSADPVIREGDEVLVEGPHALATGRAAMGAFEMARSTHGVAVRRRKVMKR